MAVLCPLVAFASASDGWYVLSLTQEIRFASVVKPVTVFGSLVALASVSDRWYALSVTQEGRFASVGGYACHCVRFTRRLPQCLTDGTWVIYSRKSIYLCGHACSIRNRTKAPSGLTHRVRPPACDSCFFLTLSISMSLCLCCRIYLTEPMLDGTL